MSKNKFIKIGIAVACIISVVLVINTISGFYIFNSESVIGSNSNLTCALYYSSTGEGEDFSCKTKKFTGVTTMWEYNSDKEQIIKGKFSVSINSGKSKIVLVDGTGKQITLFQIDARGDETRDYEFDLPITAGNNRLRLVSASVESQKISIDVPKY